MKNVFYLFIFVIGVFCCSSPINAAPQCSGSYTASDPACWTEHTNPGFWSGGWKTCTWDCTYPLSICQFASGAGFCHDTPGNCTAVHGVSCGAYSNLCYDGCGNGTCLNAGFMGGSHQVWEPQQTWNSGSTYYTCHYISSVTYPGGVCVDGVMLATNPTWSTKTYNAATCNNVATSQLCGMCEPSSVTDVYPTSSAIQSAPNPDVCYKGTLQVSSIDFPQYGVEWNWTCKYATGVSSPVCTALNKYSDYGLRIKDTNNPAGVIVVGIEDQTCFSPYRIQINGESKCIGLINNPSHPWASNARIYADGAPRAIIETSPALPAVLCGNTIIEVGEACDDGNLNNGDGCDSTCQLEAVSVCGNNITEAGEQCDDGAGNKFTCTAPPYGSCSYCKIGTCTNETNNGCSGDLLSGETGCFNQTSLINFQKCLDASAGGYPSPLSSCYYGFDSYTDADCYYEKLPASEKSKLFISSFRPAQHIYPGFCRNSYSATEKVLTSKTIFYGAQSCSTSGTCDAWKTCVKNMAITTSNVSPNLSGSEVAACKYGFNTSAAAIQVKNNFSDGGSWSVVPAGTGGLCEDYFPWSYFINCPNP